MLSIDSTWWDTMMKCGLARRVNSQILRWKPQRNPATSQCASQLRPSLRRGSWVRYWGTNATRSCALTCQPKWPRSKFLHVLYSRWVTSLKAKFEQRLFFMAALRSEHYSPVEKELSFKPSDKDRRNCPHLLWLPCSCNGGLQNWKMTGSNTTCEPVLTSNLFPRAVRKHQSFCRAHSYSYKVCFPDILKLAQDLLEYKAWMFHVNIRYSCILSVE